MSGTGYIYSSRMDGRAGRIRVCGGDFDGLNIAFLKSECAHSLQAIMRTRNISLTRTCPPPEGSLQVRFDFNIVEGDMVAVNVQKN